MTFTVNVYAAVRRLQTKIKAYKCKRFLSHGEHLHIGAGTKIWAPKHVRIGKQVYIGKNVHIEANCSIGNYCLVANRVAIVGRHDHDFTAVGFPVRFSPWVGSERSPNQFANEEAVVEDDVWLGYGVIVLTGIVIGRGSIIAAGSVVTRDVPPYSIAAGVPARVVGQRFASGETIEKHERAISNGVFVLSEKGHDYCTIDPA